MSHKTRYLKLVIRPKLVQHPELSRKGLGTSGAQWRPAMEGHGEKLQGEEGVVSDIDKHPIGSGGAHL